MRMSEMTDAYVKLDKVSKIYGTKEVKIVAVDEISFEIAKGEFVVIVGPSGAGKTTVLNILGGMDKATSGEVLVDGRNIARYNSRQLTGYRRNDIGFVFQFYNLVPNLTALENVELALQICKNPLDAREVLEEVGLKDRLTNFPAQLSGGEQQRVAIAIALANNPKLLLADEPTGAVDRKTADDILEMFRKLNEKLGLTIVIVTHDKELAKKVNRVVSIRDGKTSSERIMKNDYRERMEHLDIDWQEAAHGRAPAVATAVKRLWPDRLVFTYQGDGDLACIGTAETIHALNRGENITIIFINNAIYGMTGGQMAPTTLVGMKSSTCPYGRDVELHGYPLKITEIAAQLEGTAYVTRQSVQSVPAIRKAKKAIRKAFENSMNGKGSNLVEIVSTCSSGWKMTPEKANKWMEEHMFPFYPLGDLKDKE